VEEEEEDRMESNEPKLSDLLSEFIKDCEESEEDGYKDLQSR